MTRMNNNSARDSSRFPPLHCSARIRLVRNSGESITLRHNPSRHNHLHNHHHQKAAVLVVVATGMVMAEQKAATATDGIDNFFFSHSWSFPAFVRFCAIIFLPDSLTTVMKSKKIMVGHFLFQFHFPSTPFLFPFFFSLLYIYRLLGV